MDVVPWLSAGCPVMGILIGHSWPEQDYVTTILLFIIKRSGDARHLEGAVAAGGAAEAVQDP